MNEQLEFRKTNPEFSDQQEDSPGSLGAVIVPLVIAVAAAAAICISPVKSDSDRIGFDPQGDESSLSVNAFRYLAKIPPQ